MPLAAVAVAFLAFLATYAYGSHANSPTSSTPPSKSSGRPRAQLTPKAGNPATADRIRRLAQLLRDAWADVTGESGPMPPEALYVALAQSGMETTYGGGWSDKTSKGAGDMRGSENFGAFQGGCSAKGEDWHPVEYGDSAPPAGGGENKPIAACFRYYEDANGRTAAQNGARAFLASIVKTFPALAEMKTGSLIDYAERQGINGYFGGFNPETQGFPRWRDTWRTSLDYLMRDGMLDKRAARVGATPEEVAGRIALYARAMGQRLPEIAAALGDQTIPAYLPADVGPTAQAGDALAGFEDYAHHPRHTV